jgi:hypothetical protein
MSYVTILPGCLARTLGIAGQADWPFAYTAVCPKQTILMALNSCENKHLKKRISQIYPLNRINIKYPQKGIFTKYPHYGISTSKRIQ